MRPRSFAPGITACLLVLAPVAHAAPSDERARIESAMRRATDFMTARVGCEGGYVWTYLPDLSRRWGELEARPTMIWIQPPGTADMGEVFLDAFEATGDAAYVAAARQVARVLVRVQHPAGGWNYCADLAGEEALRDWYATIGRNAWRLEEFHRFEGNATFDDRVTATAARFLLRFGTTHDDGEVRPALDRAIAFVLDAQYPNGAWPQRHPALADAPADGRPDYSRHATFNDDVAAENIDFLQRSAATLGDERCAAAARRGMEAFLAAQQPAPQAGWALQYAADFLPAAARTYEPRALATHATGRAIEHLLEFYRQTGDPRFLERVPEALDWLDRVALPPALRRKTGRTHPTFVEIGTDLPLYLHRSGSNAANGRYFVDRDPEHTVGHYASFRDVDTRRLRAELARAEATENPRLLVRYVEEQSSRDTAKILRALNAEGWWPAPLRFTSHPYRGPAPEAVAPGDFRSTFVGDAWDTSMHPDPTPVSGISTRTYIDNMRALIARLAELKRED